MLRIVLICLLFVCHLTSAATWKLVYPRPLAEQDTRNTYPVKLLELALQHTGVNFELVPSDIILMQGRALRQLAANRQINVLWSMTDEVREKELLPIRIPIYKGLIGWRLFLVKPSVRDAMAQFEHVDELRELLPVQGRDWPDTKILQANGFDVVSSQDYRGLFDMMKGGRADFFPRSVIEIWPEATSDLAGSLVIDRHLGLHYPTAMYFFVNPKSKTLARLIETGLEKAIANGAFDKLFLDTHAYTLAQSKMGERQFFHLSNPILPQATPLARKELWFDTGGRDTESQQ